MVEPDDVGKCQPPSTVFGSDGRPMETTVNWPGVREIKFLTGSEKFMHNGKRKMWCKLKCVEGEWTGPLCSADGGIL